MKAFYNEIDAYCCAWLSNLMDAGHITPGVICDKSIEDLIPDELRGYDRVHMFAGIGGWDYALNLAGWGTREVWTGSCPCQPFSVAGKGLGFADERHLWPYWQHLIAQHCPPVLFGEQVANATKWLGLVFGDLEAMEYAVAGKPIEAASAGAEHYRDRYFFVADNDEQRASAQREQRSGELCRASGYSSDLARAMAHRPSFGWGEGWTEHDFRSRGFTASVVSLEGRQYVECTDGKKPVWRALPPPGVRWLGNGIPARVAKLRALGNAIDPRPAADFIAAYCEARGLSLIEREARAA